MKTNQKKLMAMEKVMGKAKTSLDICKHIDYMILYYSLITK